MESSKEEDVNAELSTNHSQNPSSNLGSGEARDECFGAQKLERME